MLTTKIKDILIIVLILLLGFGVWQFISKTNQWEDKYNSEIKLREALQDSVQYFQNKEGEWVAEKRTLQGDINDLEDKNVKLSNDQKELINRVSKLNKEKRVINAALIRQGVVIDSLENLIASASQIDTVNNTVSFVENDSTSNFQYDLLVSNVLPSSETKLPTLKFNKIYFPNKQMVSFQFDENERKDYPISFSVSNSNPYYKTFNIESYAIEGLQKETVAPSGWDKFKKFMGNSGKYILVGLAGYGVGTITAK